MNKPSSAQEIKVGIFLATGIGILLAAILFLGGGATFGSSVTLHAYFPEVSGLIVGAKVEVAGMRVGSIHKIEFVPDQRKVRVSVRIEKSHAKVIRKDSVAEVVTQGILGDKFLTISPGNLAEPELANGSELMAAVSKDLKSFLSGGEGLMTSLNSIAASVERLLKTFEKDNRQEVFFSGLASTAQNMATATKRVGQELEDIRLKKSVAELHEILAKINRGQGTLGALVNDPELYDDLRALLGGLNRNRVVRNLIRQSVKASDSASPAPGAQPEGR